MPLAAPLLGLEGGGRPEARTCSWGLLSALGWTVTSPCLLPRKSTSRTENSSREQITTRGINQAGFLAFFLGPKGLGAAFFVLVFFFVGFATSFMASATLASASLAFASLASVTIGSATAEATGAGATVGDLVASVFAVGQALLRQAWQALLRQAWQALFRQAWVRRFWLLFFLRQLCWVEVVLFRAVFGS